MQKLVVLAGFLFVLVQCKHEPYMVVNPNPTDTTTNPIDTTTPPSGKPCDPDSVYFQNQILPLIVSNCATSGCHDAASASDGVVLTNYANIINTGDVRPGNPGNSELYEVLIDNDPDKRMPPPPASPMSAANIALIQQWIQQGAPNNYCDGCDTTDVKFSTHIQPMLQQYCVSCHGASVQNGGVRLDNHASVVSAVTYQNLLPSINYAQGSKVMPPGGKLPDCDIAKIEIWVNQGMPNN